jgi:chromosome segregation ATPase
MRNEKLLLAVSAVIVLIAGCTDRQEALEQEVERAESRVEQLRDDAQRYLPGALQDTEQTLRDIRANVGKFSAQQLADSKTRLRETVTTLETRVAEERSRARETLGRAIERWSGLRTEVTALVAIIESRIAQLSAGTAGPQRVAPAALAEARARLAAMRQSWAEASSAFDAGQADLAVERADDVKHQGAATFKLLGLPYEDSATAPREPPAEARK